MSFPNSGNVINFYCELPNTLDNVSAIGQALLEIDMEVAAIAEPPVASVLSIFAPGNSEEFLMDEIEDYRRFYIQFKPEATEQHAQQALGIVFGALQRLSSK